MAVGGAASDGGTDDEEEEVAEIRLIRALPPSVMGLHFILSMRRAMGGLIYVRIPKNWYSYHPQLCTDS